MDSTTEDRIISRARQTFRENYQDAVNVGDDVIGVDASNHDTFGRRGHVVDITTDDYDGETETVYHVVWAGATASDEHGRYALRPAR